MNIAPQMKREPTERHPGPRRRLTIWFIVCTIFLAWASVQLWHQFNHIDEKRSEVAQVEEKLQQTKVAHRELQEKIKRLEDPEYVAELARKDYLMTGEGEIIFVQP